MAIRLEDLALREAVLARRGPDRIGSLQRQQRLVAVDEVGGGELAPEARVELLGLEPHCTLGSGFPAEAMRRMIC
jgi:hypothetical protein